LRNRPTYNVDYILRMVEQIAAAIRALLRLAPAETIAPRYQALRPPDR
jgi:hypothetical protein